MRHRARGYKLSRTVGSRRSLLKNLASSAFLHEKITTTEAKAKAVRPLIEHSISIAREGNVRARRLLRKNFSEHVVTKLIAEIAPRYRGRSGGYIRMVPAGMRRGDGAHTTVIALLEGEHSKENLSKPAARRTTLEASAGKVSK